MFQEEEDESIIMRRREAMLSKARAHKDYFNKSLMDEMEVIAPNITSNGLLEPQLPCGGQRTIATVLSKG